MRDSEGVSDDRRGRNQHTTEQQENGSRTPTKQTKGALCIICWSFGVLLNTRKREEIPCVRFGIVTALDRIIK